MKKLLVLAAALCLGAGTAFAADDSMSKDSMSKDSMGKDSMSK